MESLIKGLVVSLIFFTAIAFVSFIYSFVNNIRLDFYLKKVKYERWRDLTSIGSFGPGASNPFSWLPYVYSKLDCEDEMILRLKDSIKLGLRYCFFNIIALLVNVALMVVLWSR